MLKADRATWRHAVIDQAESIGLTWGDGITWVGYLGWE